MSKKSILKQYQENELSETEKKAFEASFLASVAEDLQIAEQQNRLAHRRTVQLRRKVAKVAAVVLGLLGGLWYYQSVATPSAAHLAKAYFAEVPPVPRILMGPKEDAQRVAAKKAYSEKQFAKAAPHFDTLIARGQGVVEDYFFGAMSHLLQSPPHNEMGLQYLTHVREHGDGQRYDEATFYWALTQIRLQHYDLAKNAFQEIVKRGNERVEPAQKILKTL